MYYELYIDVFFLVNFMMDAILLEILRKILGCPVSHGRVFLGAGAGAFGTCVWSCACRSHMGSSGLLQAMGLSILLC